MCSVSSEPSSFQKISVYLRQSADDFPTFCSSVVDSRDCPSFCLLHRKTLFLFDIGLTPAVPANLRLSVVPVPSVYNYSCIHRQYKHKAVYALRQAQCKLSVTTTTAQHTRPCHNASKIPCGGRSTPKARKTRGRKQQHCPTSINRQWVC